MAKARKILSRRNAIKSIHTVTKTMEMVATARFKRAFNRASAARQYIDGLEEMVQDIQRRTAKRKLRHPLMRNGAWKRPRIVLVITSNRGLCGAYNGAILKIAKQRIERFRRLEHPFELHVAGKRGISQLRFEGYTIDKEYREFDGQAVNWQMTADLAEQYMSAFLGREIQGLEIIYAKLLGAGQFEPTALKVLPIELEAEEEELPLVQELLDKDKDDGEAVLSPKEQENARWAPPEPYEPYEPYDRMEPLPPPEMEYEFIPTVQAMLQRLLPMTVRLEFYQCFSEGAVTEQIARMAAMRAASESAEEMIGDLTVEYNRTRQGQITTELAEIIGGAAALE